MSNALDPGPGTSPPPRTSGGEPDWLVRGLWIGPKLTELEWVSMASFIRHGARFELYTDDASRPVPAGVIVCDSRNLLGDRVYRYGKRSGAEGSYAMSGNVARLRALFELGGWWSDLDVVCLKSFRPIDSGLQFGLESTRGRILRSRRLFNVAVMRAPPRHPLIGHLLRRAQYPWLGFPWDSALKKAWNLWTFRHALLDSSNVRWGTSGGPSAFTEAVRHFALESRALPRQAFYPIHWEHWSRIPALSAEAFQALTCESYAVHLWAEMYRRAGVDKGRRMREAAWAAPYLEGFSAG